MEDLQKDFKLSQQSLHHFHHRNGKRKSYTPPSAYTKYFRDEVVEVHEAEEEEEAPINHNAKKTSSTFQNTKTNKSASVLQAVERVPPTAKKVGLMH
jgi:hypothetical protein